MPPRKRLAGITELEQRTDGRSGTAPPLFREIPLCEMARCSLQPCRQHPMPVVDPPVLLEPVRMRVFLCAKYSLAGEQSIIRIRYLTRKNNAI